MSDFWYFFVKEILSYIAGCVAYYYYKIDYPYEAIVMSLMCIHLLIEKHKKYS